MAIRFIPYPGSGSASGTLGPAIFVEAEPGEEGPIGPPGQPGASGSAGTPGTPGASGNPGPPGNDGDPGEDGPVGPMGPAGPAGSGATGAQGPLGPPVFLLGEQGDEGDAGRPGNTGLTGTTGLQGQAVYLEAVDGEDALWGPQGNQGIPGPTGATGPTGVGNLLWTEVTWEDPTINGIPSVPVPVGTTRYFRATSAEQRTSTTVLTNSTQLTVALTAIATYALKLVVFIYATTASADGITANVNYSGTFTAVGSYIAGYLMNATTTTTGIQPAQIAAASTTAIAGLTLAALTPLSSATPGVYVLEGNLIATGAGTLAFAFAQNLSGLDTANLGVGSYLAITQIV